MTPAASTSCRPSSGLGAPYWDERARGTLVGLTRGTSHGPIIVRATLEAIAYQTRDVVECVRRDSGHRTRQRCGSTAVPAANDFLMQFQADVLGVPVVRPPVLEVTALGAAALAGLAVGFWSEGEELGKTLVSERVFAPRMSSDRREALYADWQRAVERSRDWAGGGTD